LVVTALDDMGVHMILYSFIIDFAIVDGRVVSSHSITTADVLIKESCLTANAPSGVQWNARRIIDAAGERSILKTASIPWRLTGRLAAALPGRKHVTCSQIESNSLFLQLHGIA
jgi:hypothetical protein